MQSNDHHRSNAVIVLDVSKHELTDGTMDLINQRIQEVINSGQCVDGADPSAVSMIRWFDAETVASLTEAEIDATVADTWNGEP